MSLLRPVGACIPFTLTLFAAFSAAVALHAQTNVFPSSGPAGIGTTSPFARLAIEQSGGDILTARYNSANARAGIYMGATSGATFVGGNLVHSSGNVFNYDKTGLMWYLGNPGGQAFFAIGAGSGTAGTSAQTETNNLARLVITSGGNVGIGTTAPVAALQVAGDLRIGANSYYTDLLLKSAATLAGYNQANDLTPTTIPGDGVATAVLHLKSAVYGAGITRMDLIVDGNVGVGTTSPTHKLSVNGTIRAKEVIVDTGWADHVFAADYPLASLSEVEQHIRQQGRLPDVPSAAEVAAHGVSIGDVQKILLQKIEELTLHVIAQQKLIAEQGSRLEAQAGRLATLERETAQARGVADGAAAER